MTSSQEEQTKEFDKKEFEEFCINFRAWGRSHRLMAPHAPVGAFAVLMQGGADREIDGPLNSLFVAFCLARANYTDEEVFPMWVKYIEPVYDGFKWVSVGGIKKQMPKKVPIKSIARKLKISTDTFYERANKMAVKLWKSAHQIESMYSVLHKEFVDFID